MRVLVFKNTKYFRDLTFHLADRQVSPTGTCPIDEKQLFKTTMVIYMCRVTHGNLTSFKWVLLSREAGGGGLCQCVVSTRWCHSAHNKRVNDHCSKHVSRAPHFTFRRRAVAPLALPIFKRVIFFFGGI